MINSILSSLAGVPATVWFAVAAAASLAAVTSGKRRLTRPVRWKRGASLDAPTTDAAGAIVVQMQSDVFSRSFIRLLSRIHRLRPAVAAWEDRVERQQSHVDRVHGVVDATQPLAQADPEPEFSHRSSVTLRALAFSGDLVVVSGALLAHSDSLTTATALTLALAISIAIFAAGKQAGHQLREHGIVSHPKAVLAVVAVLFVVSGSLLLLRSGSVLAWFVLALCPGIAAALIVVLGPSEQQWRLHRELKSLRRAEKLLTSLDRRKARITGQLAALTRTARATLHRDIKAVEAEAQRTGTVKPTVDWRQLAAATGLDLDLDLDLEPASSLTTATDPSDELPGTIGVEQPPVDEEPQTDSETDPIQADDTPLTVLDLDELGSQPDIGASANGNASPVGDFR